MLKSVQDKLITLGNKKIFTIFAFQTSRKSGCQQKKSEIYTIVPITLKTRLTDNRQLGSIAQALTPLECVADMQLLQPVPV